MRLPLWLLKILPIFEYVCPNCLMDVSQTSYKCPYCHERYIMPLRIPPRFLINDRTLESYVHRVIFPKISPCRRNYLSKYFTLYIYDDFENDHTLSAWTQLTSAAPATITIDTTTFHWGAKAVLFTLAGTELTGYAEISPNSYVASPTAFVRAYLNFGAFPDQDTGAYCYIEINNTNERMCSVQILNNAGVWKWQMEYRNALAQHWDVIASPLPALSTWYCVEAMATVAAATGTARIWLDGVLIDERTGLANNDGSANVDWPLVGLAYVVGTSTTVSLTVDADDVAVADQPIGCLYPFLDGKMRSRIKREHSDVSRMAFRPAGKIFIKYPFG